jgi:hypothetical protein
MTSITDEALACAAVLLACRRADELDNMGHNPVFQTAIASRNIFIGHDPALLVEAAQRCLDQAGGFEALVDAAVGAIRPETRLPLLFHCLDVMLANGVVTPQEHKSFQYLKRKFKADEEMVWKGMEVLVLKNQL